MSLTRINAADAIARLDTFDSVIDTRSESEFAHDRLPGAANWPSLDDAERRLVGTEYSQVSPFIARKRGAALVARNIARHIEREVLDKPKDWKPLVYCWRGGLRSAALAAVLDQIGFRTTVLAGGYREYRRAVVADLEQLPQRFGYRVVCGKTGTGKSRLLRALRHHGAQVLDLEELASHRGSVLGGLPGQPQPSQKRFDSLVWSALKEFDPSRVVWVESESRKVGELRVPQALVDCMHRAPCLRIEMPLAARVALLVQDYAFFLGDVPGFVQRVDALRALRGNEVVKGWQEAARAGEVDSVVLDLLLRHYDPGYDSSMSRNFAGFDAAEVLQLANGSPSALDAAALALLG